jgi:hypothetical protein
MPLHTQHRIEFVQIIIKKYFECNNVVITNAPSLNIQIIYLIIM